MNPHYHPYTELPSPHSPPPDNNNYQHAPITNGHMITGATSHEHHLHHPFTTGPPHHHHHINNSTNNNNNNNINNNNTSNNINNSNNNGVKMCAGCGGKIVERYLLHALDRYWHHGCLKCSCCAQLLADMGSSCFTKAGMVLCKADYIRLFGNTGACSACGQIIPASELVMRAGSGNGQSHHVFHLKCFACSKCGSQLIQGDRYYILAGSLVCEQDWHKLLKSSGVSGPGGGPTTVRKGKVGRPRRSRD